MIILELVHTLELYSMKEIIQEIIQGILPQFSLVTLLEITQGTLLEILLEITQEVSLVNMLENILVNILEHQPELELKPIQELSMNTTPDIVHKVIKEM